MEQIIKCLLYEQTPNTIIKKPWSKSSFIIHSNFQKNIDKYVNNISQGVNRPLLLFDCAQEYEFHNKKTKAIEETLKKATKENGLVYLINTPTEKKIFDEYVTSIHKALTYHTHNFIIGTTKGKVAIEIKQHITSYHNKYID